MAAQGDEVQESDFVSSKNITTFASTTTQHVAYTQSLPAVKSEGFFKKNLKSFGL